MSCACVVRVTAFVMQTLNDAQEKDWELDIFIATELLNKIMLWLCEQQSPEGAFIEHAPIYDRKMRVSTIRVHYGEQTIVGGG